MPNPILREAQLQSLFDRVATHTDPTILAAVAPNLLKDLASEDESVATWPNELPEYLAQHLCYLHNKGIIAVDDVLLAGMLLRLLDHKERQKKYPELSKDPDERKLQLAEHRRAIARQLQIDEDTRKTLLTIISQSKYSLLELLVLPKTLPFKQNTHQLLLDILQYIYRKMDFIEKRLHVISKKEARNEMAAQQEEIEVRSNPSPTGISDLESVTDPETKRVRVEGESKAFLYAPEALAKVKLGFTRQAFQWRACIQRFSSDRNAIHAAITANDKKLNPVVIEKLTRFYLLYPNWRRWLIGGIKKHLATIVALLDQLQENELLEKYLKLIIAFLQHSKSHVATDETDEVQTDKSANTEQLIYECQKFLLEQIEKTSPNRLKQMFCTLLQQDLPSNWGAYSPKIRSLLYKNHHAFRGDWKHLNNQCIAFRKFINPRDTMCGLIVSPETLNSLQLDSVTESLLQHLALIDFSDPNVSIHPKKPIEDLIIRLWNTTQANGTQKEIKVVSTCEIKANKSSTREKRVMVGDIESAANDILRKAWWNGKTPTKIRIDGSVLGLDDEILLPSSSVFISIFYEDGKYILRTPTLSCDFIISNDRHGVTELAGRIMGFCRTNQIESSNHSPIVAMRFRTYLCYVDIGPTMIWSRSSTPTKGIQRPSDDIVRSNSEPSFRTFSIDGHPPLDANTQQVDVQMDVYNPFKQHKKTLFLEGASIPLHKPDLPRIR